MIKAIIFDFDGTILDTETPDYHCWKNVFEEHGCELAQDDWCKVVGTSWDVFNPFDHLEGQLGRGVDRVAVRKAQQVKFHELVAKQVPLPGVESVLASAKEMGLSLAVASSSGRPWVEGHLERLGLMPYFSALKTSEDVEQVKPDPALYTLALEALGVLAEEAVAFEDSVNGVKAAKAAGIRCIAIPNSVTANLDFAHADEVWDSLLRCDLEVLVRGA